MGLCLQLPTLIHMLRMLSTWLTWLTRLSPRIILMAAVVSSGTLTMMALTGAPASAANGIVTVRLGDTLTAIAARNHTTVSALAAANGLADPNRVDAGTVLRLPGVGPADAAASVADGAPKTVVVVLGDDLTQIAARNHTTVAALVAANGITDPNQVVAGTVLRLPGPNPPPVTAQTAAQGAPRTVVVRLGDDLTQIAARNQTTVAALVAANGIANPNQVVAGTLLRLPGSTMALASYDAPLEASGAADPGEFPAALLANPSRLSLLSVFKQAAAAAGVPASLLEAMCWWESGWQAGVVSPTGAVGVCQIEPATAGFIKSTLLHNAAVDPHVASQNIELAAAYLGYLLQQTSGNQQLALGAYYAGLSAVLKNGMSAATQNYVNGIAAYIAIFAAAG